MKRVITAITALAALGIVPGTATAHSLTVERGAGRMDKTQPQVKVMDWEVDTSDDPDDDAGDYHDPDQAGGSDE